jgi:hypothetical protein
VVLQQVWIPSETNHTQFLVLIVSGPNRVPIRPPQPHHNPFHTPKRAVLGPSTVVEEAFASVSAIEHPTTTLA